MSATIFTFITHNQNYHHVCGVFGGLLAVITIVQITVRCDKWTWRKTPPHRYHLLCYLFKEGLHSNQQIEGTTPRRCKKKGPLTFIHSLLAADTVQAAAVNELKWTGSTTSYTQAWMRWRGQCLVERHISKSIRSFFLSSSDENYCSARWLVD